MIVPELYKPITKGIELLENSDINSIVIKSKCGLGKSFWTDYAVKDNKNCIVFKGTISEARFFKFIQDNSNKLIIMRDCGSMLRRLSFLDFLKSATDLTKVRKISRINYSNHEGVEETINFEGKIVWEINDIPKKNLEDLSAVIDRSIFIELNPSIQEIKNIMYDICKNRLEKKITKYILLKSNQLDLNFRLQNKCFQIAKSAIKSKKDWKKEVDMFISTQYNEARQILYRIAGNGTIRRIEFVKFLMREKGISYTTAQRRITEYLILGEIFSDSKLKQSMISINPIKNVLNVLK